MEAESCGFVLETCGLVCSAGVTIQVPTLQAPAQAKALVTARMASPSPRGEGDGTGFGVGGRGVIPGGSMVSAGR